MFEFVESIIFISFHPFNHHNILVPVVMVFPAIPPSGSPPASHPWTSTEPGCDLYQPLSLQVDTLSLSLSLEKNKHADVFRVPASRSVGEARSVVHHAYGFVHELCPNHPPMISTGKHGKPTSNPGDTPVLDTQMTLR